MCTRFGVDKMILYIFAITLLLLVPSRLFIRRQNEDYISKDTCNVVKGVFILLIFASHFFNSYSPSVLSPMDQAYTDVRIFLGQCVVSAFLFYSGYGIVESVKKKGFAYTKALPRKRILKTLLIYDLSVLIFIAKDIIIRALGYDVRFDRQVLAKSFIALTSAGNDNWYIFVIVCLYAFSWLAFRAFREDGRDRYRAAAVITALTLALVFSLKDSGYNRYWYNSMLCYPAGCWFSLFEKDIKPLMKKNYLYYPLLAGVVFAFVFFQKHWEERTLYYCLATLLFAVLVILVTMKFSPRNPFLRYCGVHLNSLFLMHKLPMSLLVLTPISRNHYLHFALSVILTFVIAFLFEKLTALVGKAFSALPKKLKAGGE